MNPAGSYLDLYCSFALPAKKTFEAPPLTLLTSIKSISLLSRWLNPNTKAKSWLGSTPAGHATGVTGMVVLFWQAKLLAVGLILKKPVPSGCRTYTGQVAVLDGYGRTFEQVAAERGKKEKAPPIEQAAPAESAV